MKIILIAAIGISRQIGFNGQIPWPRLKQDLEWFRSKTLDHYIVMGRATWESMGSKALAKRTNIVLTKTIDLEVPEGVFQFPSISALYSFLTKSEMVHTYLSEEEMEVFIIGGEEIYKQFLPLADQIYLTRVYADPIYDRQFPEFDMDNWVETADVIIHKDELSGIAFQFFTYTRK